MRSVRPSAVVITGAASGLGKALALAYHRRGSALALIDRDAHGLAAVKAACTEGPTSVTIHVADVGRESEVMAACDAVIAAHGGVRVLINNAAVSMAHPFAQMDLAAARALFDTNYWGYVYTARQFLPHLLAHRTARLVNVSSIFATMGFPGKAAYAGSKAAIVGTTHALRAELAGTGVKVCTVIPPAMDTGLVRNGLHMSAEKRAHEEGFLRDHGMDVHRVARCMIPAVERGRSRIMHRVARCMIPAVERGRSRIVIGTRMKLLDLGLRILPGTVQRIVTARARRMPFV